MPHRERDRKAGREAARQTGRQAGRQADRQTDRQTEPDRKVGIYPHKTHNTEDSAEAHDSWIDRQLINEKPSDNDFHHRNRNNHAIKTVP